MGRGAADTPVDEEGARQGHEGPDGGHDHEGQWRALLVTHGHIWSHDHAKDKTNGQPKMER